MNAPASSSPPPDKTPARRARRQPQRSGRRPSTAPGQPKNHPFTPAQIQARQAQVPAITYPAELPVSARRADIAAAIAAHQVVVISGETGSGKTTQIPKICLELGRGINGMIGHTQPRRLAARAVAERIAKELGQNLSQDPGHTPGQAVGFQVRFTDETGPNTLIKLMTDGILLAETAHDPLLRRYDTIIIDEAHERSLNIDFLLGYLARLLPRRPDLKLIITSATIDAQRFAAHFIRYANPPRVPALEVSGRTYPVEIRYQPLISSSALDMTDSLACGAQTASSADPAPVETSIDQVTGIIQACEELMAHGPGDILVFLPGERDIRDTQAALAEHLGARYLAPGQRPQLKASSVAVEVLPLYARLTAAEQHRIFAPHSHRRIVLSTNVAETSLTVPGIHYVVDPGLARISRFSNRTKVQRLPIEPISQASANQRSGRCGRVANGVAIRLYSEADYASRPEFTEPEILRTSLAAVILQMAALDLGQVEDFPFLDQPDLRAIKDGINLLYEIGAVSLPGKAIASTQVITSAPTTTTDHPTNTSMESTTTPGSDELGGDAPASNVPTRNTPGLRLTALGKRLARLPVDPRLGRMLLEAGKTGCASEVAVIVAALSIQDVRERPLEHQGAADEAHGRFLASSSDFLTYLSLWRYLLVQQRELSGAAFRRLCRTEFLHYLRFREWQDVVGQLRELARPLGLGIAPLSLPSSEQIAAQLGDVAGAVVDYGRSADTPDAQAIHQALLTGLLSGLGSWDEQKHEYQGARAARFVVWPGSALAKKAYPWIMSAELVETSRLFARTAARIKPEWIEPVAGHLVKRSYSEPYWSRHHGSAMCKEKVMLYGLTLTAARPVLLGRQTGGAKLAREMFIENALVQGDWRHSHAFQAHNQRMLDEAREVERRRREVGLVAGEDEQFAFYHTRLPAHITGTIEFEKWWKTTRRTQPDLLNFTADFVLPTGPDLAGFPDHWVQAELTLPLKYDFVPGLHTDGVSVSVPLSILPRLKPSGFDWLIPGMLAELCLSTIRALPKAVRRQLVPAPDCANDIVDWLRSHFPSPVNLGVWDADLASQAANNVPSSVYAAGQAQALPQLNGPEYPSFQAAFTVAAACVRDVYIPPDVWDETRARLPEHLRLSFRILGADGEYLGSGQNLGFLQKQFAKQSALAVTQAVQGAVALAYQESAKAASIASIKDANNTSTSSTNRTHNQSIASTTATARAANAPTQASTTVSPITNTHNLDLLSDNTALTSWPQVPDGQIPEVLDIPGPHGLTVRGYPTLQYHHNQVSLTVAPDLTTQIRQHPRGIVQLLLQANALPTPRVTSRWSGNEALVLAASPYKDTAALVLDAQLAATWAIAKDWEQANFPLFSLRNATDFSNVNAQVRQDLEDQVYRVLQLSANALRSYQQLQLHIRSTNSMFLLNIVQDIRQCAAELIYPGFISHTPPEYLVHLDRYLRGYAHRLQRAKDNVHQDAALAWQVDAVAEAIEKAQETSENQPYDPALQTRLTQSRWLLEELRVSLFAQQLGTPVKVSAKRIQRLLAQ